MSAILAAVLTIALAAPPTVEADIVASVPIGQNDLRMAGPVFSRDGATAYVGERDTVDGTRQNIRVLDARKHTTKAVHRVGVQYHSITDLKLSPDGGRLYALQTGFGGDDPGQITVVDAVTGAELRTIRVPAARSLGNFDSHPGALDTIALSPDGSRLYLTQTGDVITPGAPEPGNLYVIDTASGAFLGKTPVPGWIPGSTLISPDGKNIYVSTLDVSPSRTVTIHQLDATATPPRYAGAVYRSGKEEGDQFALSPDGSRIYVLGYYQSDLRTVDIASRTVVARLSIPDQSGFSPLALSADGTRLFVGSTALDQWQTPTVSEVDAAALTFTRVLTGFDLEDQHGLVTTPDSRELWVTGKPFEGTGADEIQSARLYPRR
ncbi:hypothetical protein D5S17_27650 [Pseudonocardiaceae bacterium YIM PH 21723]|nr:hypothetical protein D5S17_27650 [Pseudonocardiaceae bacterium YIM PH 21723]